ARWLDKGMIKPVLRAADSFGFARSESWNAGAGDAPPVPDLRAQQSAEVSPEMVRLLDRAAAGRDLSEADIVRLFAAREQDLQAVLDAADSLRREIAGDTVTFVSNRNINYTNICLYHCTFCAFSKGGGARDARGPAYKLDLAEVAKRSVEAWEAGATEVCLQGGIHPDYTGDTYLSIVRAVKDATPDMHVHAFSPLEITHGAETLGLSLEVYLRRLKEAGLSTLPGTAAEILDDEIRDIICADKVNTDGWLAVMEAAHTVGLRSTATIMYGHVEQPKHWARHLLRVRNLQKRTGGFTEFVPLPFVHMEAPMWRQGLARSGPTFREAVLMHAVARLVLHPHIANIQTSWVKMGPEGAALCLQAGANDLGGTLMNESITRAAGGVNGQLLDEAAMTQLTSAIGRPLKQRTTLYGEPVLSKRRLDGSANDTALHG
ncbi:MAG: 5-amino-6-(D-ribitylamino)uracil--L-tyrosine 4-hydroxyphenyl transferase CofH, partial [Caulobacterales bacterium]